MIRWRRRRLTVEQLVPEPMTGHLRVVVFNILSHQEVEVLPVFILTPDEDGTIAT